MRPAARRKKTKIVVTCLLFLLTIPAHTQSLNEYRTKGDRYYARMDFENALKNYLVALDLDANDAGTNFRAGISYLNSDNYREAARYLEKAYELNPSVDTHIHYHLGVAYQKDLQFMEAIEHFQTIVLNKQSLTAVAKQKIRECQLGDSLMRLEPIASVEPLPEEINTSFAEFAPLISRDGATLYFSSNRSDNEYHVKSATNFEDVYIARKNGSGWSPAEKLSHAINVRLNDAATAISANGKTLFLYYDEGGGDIYTSTFEHGKWTRPVALNRFINHPHFRESSACISPDGRKLYFSSNRPGGKGGFDIYVSELQGNGQWGRPSNLGSTINTRQDEEMPFLHSDGVTLYFTSNGHAGLGGDDIFRSTLHDARWTRPENLRYPVNTSADEGYFILAEDGKTGYYARPGTGQPSGNMDIYQVVMKPPRIMEAAEVAERRGDATENIAVATLVHGMVTDISTGQPLRASLSLIDRDTKTKIATVSTDSAGRFELIIRNAGAYLMTAEHEGYLFNSTELDIPAFSKSQQMERHIGMTSATVGSSMVLKNIFFDVNRARLEPESLAELQQIRDMLVKNPGLRIQVSGHTDNVGDPDANRALSLRRAEAVVKYLVSEGISAERLVAKGYGSERPLVSNDDEEEGRQLNRRTEIEIIE